jgi:hypothetical protein
MLQTYNAQQQNSRFYLLDLFRMQEYSYKTIVKTGKGEFSDRGSLIGCARFNQCVPITEGAPLLQFIEANTAFSAVNGLIYQEVVANKDSEST